MEIRDGVPAGVTQYHPLDHLQHGGNKFPALLEQGERGEET
jgi:hypothetical protein